MTDLDLDELQRLADESLIPNDNGAIWAVSMNPNQLQELVRQARAHQKHVMDVDLWQEIGRIKERLDNLENR